LRTVDASRHAVSALAIIRECGRALAARGTNILGEVLDGAADAQEWRHYPAADAFDPRSHAQYFFHRHATADEAGEAGHFHLFLRAEGMPAGAMPLLLPEAAIANLPTPPQAAPLKRGARDEVSHLVAIAIDAAGEPIRMFTTNRWVTGETWYPADDVIHMLDRFTLDAAEPAGPVNAWLTALVRLYQPEIATLLRRRDDAIMDPRRRRRRVDVFEDPKLEVLSSLAIDLEQKLSALDQVASAPWPQPARAPPRLPPMADGWGS
jgi:uncharacterized protein DUF6969